MANSKTILSKGVYNVNQTVDVYCLPKREICFPFTPNGLLVECGKEWNCNLKCAGDIECYYMPHRTDVLQIQTQFFDSGRENPIGGTVVELCDLQGNPIGNITDIQDDFDEYSCQTITIDFSLPIFDDLECFSFKIYPPNEVEEPVCTQQMKFTEDCSNSILIESKYEGIDCGGNKYGNGYSNKIRIPFTLKYFGVQSTATIFNDELDTTNIRNFYRLIAEKKIPPFMMWLLGSVIFGSNKICITDECGTKEYDFESSGRINPIAKGSMFSNVAFELYEECESNHSC